MGEGKGQWKDPVAMVTECSVSDCGNVSILAVMWCYGSERGYHCGKLGKGHRISLCIIFTTDPTIISVIFLNDTVVLHFLEDVESEWWEGLGDL